MRDSDDKKESTTSVVKSVSIMNPINKKLLNVKKEGKVLKKESATKIEYQKDVVSPVLEKKKRKVNSQIMKSLIFWMIIRMIKKKKPVPQKAPSHRKTKSRQNSAEIFKDVKEDDKTKNIFAYIFYYSCNERANKVQVE